MVVGRNKKQIQIRVGPKPAHFGLEFGIVDLLRAIFLDPSVRPCDHVSEFGLVFRSGAFATCGMEKLAVGFATSHTSPANARVSARSINDRLLVNIIGYGRGAFLNSGAISYALSNSASASASFPS